MARTPHSSSVGKNQYSIIKSVGDGSYPPFSVRRIDGRVVLFSKYIFLTNYTETYSPDYAFDHPLGKVNSIPQYSVTERTIDISFTMAARNVHEAKNNLRYCRQLARAPYGTYAVVGYDADNGTIEHAYESQPRYTITFGTFLRDQEVEILNYDFSIDFEAGVFDYGSTPYALKGPDGEANPNIGKRSDDWWQMNDNSPSEFLKEDSYVYHGQSGQVYPKAINVKLSLLCFHEMPLGFGGSLRPAGSKGWSLNEQLDWPHGTGPIPPADYCKAETVRRVTLAEPLTQQVVGVHGRRGEPWRDEEVEDENNNE